MKQLTTLSLLLLIAQPLTLAADDTAASNLAQCDAPAAEIPLASELGSAGFMQNLAGHPDSLRAIAGRLLNDALSEETLEETANCKPNCPAEPATEVVYRVSPTAFLAADRQNATCKTFEHQTSAAPLQFSRPAFRTVDELNEWIMDLSQGRGEDGHRLYQRCTSNCSPRYTFTIAAESTGYAVKAEVLCGLARDKSKNQYRISTALRRTCAIN